MSAAEQIQQCLGYIQRTYGRSPLTPGEAEWFSEPDEDPAKIFAAFDAPGKGVTAPPQVTP